MANRRQLNCGGVSGDLSAGFGADAGRLSVTELLGAERERVRLVQAEAPAGISDHNYRQKPGKTMYCDTRKS